MKKQAFSARFDTNCCVGDKQTLQAPLSVCRTKIIENMQDEHEFVRKNMERIRLELKNENMTILDFVKSQQASTMEELSEIIKDIPESEEPTKQELIQMAIELASDASKIYNKGFNEAIELIAKCDSKFLSRKVPPHVLA